MRERPSDSLTRWVEIKRKSCNETVRTTHDNVLYQTPSCVLGVIKEVIVFIICIWILPRVRSGLEDNADLPSLLADGLVIMEQCLVSQCWK